MGFESCDQQILDKVNKQTTVEKIKTVFKICKEEKIRTIASVAFGMPRDAHESIKKL